METRHVSRVLKGLVVAVVLSTLFLGNATVADGYGAVTRGGTSNHQQAVRKAKEYLQIEAFSLKGLVAQLKYDGFSTSDATYGARHAGANWFKQATRKAKEYLKVQAFSYSGMVQQLEYDKFTPAQARYGARHAGLRP